MKKKLSPQAVIDQYVEIGLILRDTALNGDYKTGNKEIKRIIALFKILEKDIDLAKATLPLLFNNENITTRNRAASHCLSLKIFIDEAQKVLEEAAQEGIRSFSFEAEMVLKVWKEDGFLKVYPNQIV